MKLKWSSVLHSASELYTSSMRGDQCVNTLLKGRWQWGKEVCLVSSLHNCISELLNTWELMTSRQHLSNLVNICRSKRKKHLYSSSSSSNLQANKIKSTEVERPADGSCDTKRKECRCQRRRHQMISSLRDIFYPLIYNVQQENMSCTSEQRCDDI